MFLARQTTALPTADTALAGRSTPMPVTAPHAVLGTSMTPPFPEGIETALFASGCFWGAERLMWQVPGVWTTAVGYAGGFTPNPTYREVCTGRTGHTETVLVAFDPGVVSYGRLLQLFWEDHDPTQGMRQGNDVGTQYRSAVFTNGATQAGLAEESRIEFGARMAEAGFGPITTEIAPAGEFFYAESEHQQYLAKNPSGYDCHIRTGVACPLPG